MAGPYIRTFWTVQGKVDKDGHPIEYPTEAAAKAQASGGGIGGTGVAAGLGPIPAATAATKVTEVMTEDGEYVQTTEGPDGQPQEITRGVDKARLDLFKARQAAAPGAKEPDVRTFPDGSLRERQPDGTWKVLAEKPPVAQAAPTLHTLPDGSQAQYNPATGNWDVKFTKPATAPKDELPEITVPARRPGQTTDLATVKSEADTYLANLNAQVAAGTLTRAERSRLWDSYYQTTVKPRLEQANQEANAEAARLARRTTAREDRETSLGEAEFGQKAGRYAVADALALLPYQVSPTFLREFAAGLNTLSSGGGHVAFSPEAFQIQLPDLNALADAGAQRAAAAYRGTAGVPFTPQGAVAPAAAPAPAAAAAAPSAAAQALAGVPMRPRPQWDPASAGGPGSSPYY
jgi:hypothetical protein